MNISDYIGQIVPKFHSTIRDGLKGTRSNIDIFFQFREGALHFSMIIRQSVGLDQRVTDAFHFQLRKLGIFKLEGKWVCNAYSISGVIPHLSIDNLTKDITHIANSMRPDDNAYPYIGKIDSNGILTVEMNILH